jgi:hypothetical protein
VLRLAEEQTVTGIVYDGISQLDAELLPGKELQMQLATKVLQTENRNRKVDAVAKDVSKRLSDAGIRTVILKGQGVAREYAKPEHRQPGDIDMYVCNGKISEARNLSKTWNISDANENSKHYFFEIDGAHVELHRKLVNTQLFIYAGRFNSWLMQRMDTTGRTIDGFEVPDRMSAAAFEFYHLFHHFMNEGVGLRQVCDWCRCLHNAHGELDTALLKRSLYHCGMLHSWRAFGCMAVKYLGLPREEMPLYEDTDEAKASKILDIILRIGNFGHNMHHTRSKNYFVSKWQGVKYNIQGTFSLFPLFRRMHCET